ncbi:hypothetical protein GLOTRDRAFT_106024 [Gloeophyllum trabeum ATCC 11539]|uniref:Tyr recombinase domain-containing protein n=1 Tax=Gloeophyllum trabeum (strain ATCC 11539 / FP-39264 / Madison 617) TaxID=670483 RepID=S7Q792_GLOTA|nr:uncharacterized protein GLOTRDRAFT_106024 [Gloeophyllum trabeum ATCC 11539]EPQ55313.1 hypothetical protein GLOTRDRAFT_106024 [Gloeophyllum trabeum ATCC 11539]
MYVTYMSAHIEPRSVDSYLSGICSGLESYFPHVREARKSRLVSRTLRGCKRRYSQPVSRAQPMSVDDLGTIHDALHSSTSHDDKLFLALVFTGFYALMRLGELVHSDNPVLRDPRKLTLRDNVTYHRSHYQFTLPTHKADLFESNSILIRAQSNRPDPVRVFTSYISSRDALAGFRPQLWLREDGSVPTREWFMRRLRRFRPKLTGHSMRCGGTTFLAMTGVTPENIRRMGRWSSNAWEIYVRKHPVILQAFVFGGQATGDPTAA